MLKVALLSRWHVHADEYASYANDDTNVEIIRVWDENIERGIQWATELGVPFEKSLDNIFNNPEINGVIVTTPTNMHKEIIIGAAKSKKHVFTEKVLATTISQCEEIYTAVEENGVKLMVSLPRLTEPYFLFVENAIKNGVVGQVNMIRCKVAHDGALPSKENPSGWLPEYFYDKDLCGGGAMIDFGAHPIYISNRLCGNVKKVTSLLSKFISETVDDNSVILAEYESGALGILEASFVTKGSPFFLEVFGTKNTIIIEDNLVKLRDDNGNWTTPKLPIRDLMPFTQWVESIINNYEPTITKEDVINLSLVNDLAFEFNKI